VKNRKLGLLVLLLISILLSSCQSYAVDNEQVSSDEKLIIRFSHVVGEDTPKGEAARRFAQLIKERSNGKIEVQVFANGSLYRDGEEYTALVEGDIQMIAPAMSKMTDQITELQFFDLPFFFSSLDQIHKLADGKVGELVFESAKGIGVEPLAIWDNGFKQFTSNLSFLTAPDRFQNLTFRIMPSEILSKQFAVLGAQAEVRNFNEVYQSIINKEVDGQENTISNIYTKRFYEVQNYLTLSNHGYLGYLVIMNQDFWNNLSPEYQELISTTLTEVTLWQRERAEELQEKQLQYIQQSEKIQIRSMTDTEWLSFNELYKPLYAELEQKIGSVFFKQMKALLE